MFDITTLILPQVAKHLRQHPFERVVRHLTPFLPVLALNREIAVVCDIKRSAIEMTAVLCGITVFTFQLRHIISRAQHTGDNDLMQRYLFHLQTVKEISSNVLEQ